MRRKERARGETRLGRADIQESFGETVKVLFLSVTRSDENGSLDVKKIR
jgi:hypothetical protein